MSPMRRCQLNGGERPGCATGPSQLAGMLERISALAICAEAGANGEKEDGGRLGGVRTGRDVEGAQVGADALVKLGNFASGVRIVRGAKDAERRKRALPRGAG